MENNEAKIELKKVESCLVELLNIPVDLLDNYKLDKKYYKKGFLFDSEYYKLNQLLEERKKIKSLIAFNEVCENYTTEELVDWWFETVDSKRFNMNCLFTHAGVCLCSGHNSEKVNDEWVNIPILFLNNLVDEVQYFNHSIREEDLDRQCDWLGFKPFIKECLKTIFEKRITNKKN